MNNSTNQGSQILVEFSTKEAIGFKVISKILEKNFVDATFIVTERGIYVQENNGDHNNPKTVTAILDVVLNRNKFTGYFIPKVEGGKGQICLGFSTSDLKNALERVVKTDALRIYIDSSKPSVLQFEIKNTQSNNTSIKSIALKSTNIGVIIPPDYRDYDPTVVVDSTAFKKATTDANKNSKTSVKVSAQEHGLKIENTNSVLRGGVDTFGKWIEGEDLIYSANLSTVRLHSFSEIAVKGVSSTIQIYARGDGLPLKISSDVGSLGTISLYLQEAPSANEND